jgi:hypothetical protein
VARGKVRLYLSEHKGNARPDTLIHLYVKDIDAVSAEFGIPVDEDGSRDGSATSWTRTTTTPRRHAAIMNVNASCIPLSRRDARARATPPSPPEGSQPRPLPRSAPIRRRRDLSGGVGAGRGVFLGFLARASVLSRTRELLGR